MAGSYPDVPGYRFAYDIDGTTAVQYAIGGGAPTLLSSGNLTTMNRTQADPGTWTAYNPGGHRIVSIIFPETRTILGYFMSIRAGYNPVGGRIMQTSTDTTDGIDGSWSTAANPYQYIDCDSKGLTPYQRANINAVNFSNIKSIRFNVHEHISAFHLYGSIETTESPDRLRVIDISDDDIVAQLDFGNMAQRANSTKQFKVINNSSTLNANNITISLDAPTDASPSLIGQYQVSTDNLGYANAVNIGTLAPGASSGTLYIRNNVANNAQLGPWTARIIAHPTSWS